MLQSGSDAGGTEPKDVVVEEHVSFHKHRIVSEILVQIIEDLPVFRLNSAKKDCNCIYEGIRNVGNKSFCEELSSNSADTRHPEDGNTLHCSKLVKDEVSIERNEATNVVLDHDLVQCKIPNSADSKEEVNCEIDEDVINSCIKEKILFALHLSPVSKDFSNVEDKSELEKKKESVHFNSPVAVVYEFSERSEAVSDDSTEILSDTDSEDFPLSQTKYTDNLHLQNEEANLNAIDSEQDITRLLNFHETGFDGCMKDCIMTPAGDCFNTRLSENIDVPLEQSVELIDKTDGDNIKYNSQSKLSTHCDNYSVMMTWDNEVCVKQETEESSVHLQKGDLENDQSKNDKIVCSPAANGDTVTMSEDVKSGDINPDKQETMESPTETSGEICNSENRLLDRGSCNLKECTDDTNNQTILHEEAVVLSSSGEGDGKLVNLTTVENLCKKHDNDVNEIFTKFHLVQKEDATGSPQDLLINYEQENTTEVETANKSGRNSSRKSNSCDCEEYAGRKSINNTNFGNGSSQQKCIQSHTVSCNDKCRNCGTDSNEEFISTVVECESKGEMMQPSQQNESKNYISTGNDVEDRKENRGITENVLCQVGKREQSSPELHFSQISKKSKSDIEDNLTSHTRKRKLFKIGLDESGNVKLLKLDNGHDQFDNGKVPKLLKQLASDVISSLDENVIWDSQERVEGHIEKQKDFDEAHQDITAEFCVSERTLSDQGADNDCTDLMTVVSESIYFSLEKQDKISDSKIFSSQYAEELQFEEFETKSLCKSENDQNTSLITTSGHINCYQDTEAPHIETSEVCDKSQSEDNQSTYESENDQNTSQARTAEHINNHQDIKAPRTETSKVCDKSHSEETQSPCESENDGNALLTRTSEHINTYQDKEVPWLKTFELCDKSQSGEHITNTSQNMLNGPGFISATELLSQSSQDSASTGFTVNVGDLSCSPDLCEKNSFDDSEVRQIDTVREFLKENGLTSENVQHCEQELEHVGVTIQPCRTKSIVEITEDGLKEEKLEDADVGIILSSDQKKNVELVGGRQGSHTATDQDEQIDTDELDMYVDRAVDQIVPDECADISDGSVETVGEQALYIKDEDQKPKLYACDLDLCNEQDDPLCKPINKSGKLPYEKCFNWKYRPSCDVDSDAHLPELPDEDHVVMITPLKTCGKPLRLGLSKRQPVKNSLHKLGIRK